MTRSEQDERRRLKAAGTARAETFLLGEMRKTGARKESMVAFPYHGKTQKRKRRKGRSSPKQKNSAH